MDGILPVGALMGEVYNMCISGRDMKKYIEGKDYNSKTLNSVKGTLHHLKAEKRGKLIKWLSVGVGEGRDLEVLYAEGLRPINLDFYGIDRSDELFEEVKESASKLGIPERHVHLKAIPVEEMNFKLKFDLISAVLVLHEVDPVKLPRILGNMLRSLRKGGTLVISDFQKPYEPEKNVVVWDDRDIKYLLKQISQGTGASFEIMDSSEFPDEFGFYVYIIKRIGSIRPLFFEEDKDTIMQFINIKIDNTRKDKEKLENEVYNRIAEIIDEKEIDISTLLKHEDQIAKVLDEEKYKVKLHKVILLRNQLEYLHEKFHERVCHEGPTPPPDNDPIQVYVESIKNNDFYRYITNPVVGRSILLECLYVKLAISGIVHDPEHRFAMPDWVAGKEYQLFTERRYIEKVKEEMDPKDAVEEWRRIVVLGAPGSGKTTLLKYLTLEAANGRLKGELVPFFISLGEYADPRNKATSLIEFACEQYIKPPSLDQEEFGDFVLMVRDLNEKRKALFLLDGFDEMPHDLKRGISGDIERELNRYVISSRQFGYTGGILNDKTLEVVELSDPAIREFIQNWMRSHDVPDHEKNAERLIDHLQIPRLKMLARNPLLLSIQCFVYQSMVKSGTGVEMPTRMVDLYKASIIGLLKTLERRGITNHDVDSLDRKICVNSVFADIAFHYFEEVENAPRHIFGKEELNEFLRPISGKLGDHYAELLSEVIFQSGILHPLTINEYHFLHLTFQEYYTAYHLANQEDGIKTIAEKKRDPHWQEEVIPLYAGMKSERFQELIDRIWNNGGDEDIFYNDLFLIGRCLAEVDLEIAEIKSHDIEEMKNRIFELSLRGELSIWREGANEVLSHIYYQFEDIDDKIRENLKDEDSFVRWCAAGALEKIGGGKAFEHLIPLLKDEDPHVRNRAVEALGTIGDKRAVKHLTPLLKERDGGDAVGSWIAMAALEAIMGRKIFKHPAPPMKDEYYYYDMPLASEAHEKIWNGEAFEHLMQQVKDKRSRITMGGATITFGEMGGVKAFEQLMPLLNDENSNVRGNAVGVLGVIGDTRAFEQLIPLLKDENSDVRGSAARALGTIGDTRAAKHLIPLLKDENSDVRHTAAISLGKIGDAKDVEHLIPLLKDENSNVRSNAAISLGKIGDAKDVEHLIPLLKDNNPLVRRHAADTLRMISENNNLCIPLSRYKNL